MKYKQEELIQIEGLYNFWIDCRNKLRKENISINVVDFDDTLFSRKEQLEKEKELQKNRGDNGTKFILKNIGMSKFLDKYYKNKEIPKNIIGKMNNQHDIILTAGIYEFQIAKVQMCNQLKGFKTIITKNGKEKIKALIRYILFDIKFIPKKITIYEDRPEYFLEYKGLLKDIVNTKIEIIKVEMRGNNKEAIITKQ